ncbi:MAG TPA: divalent-cation tolerance protein CutA [Thermoanaerobaculia bacterium]|nr:divalent-cation tolerance protein CutA [Thermoanaerobaculia bacterium]
MAAVRAIVMVTTVGTEEQANLIAREIVVRRQAACVNIVPAIRSIYRWQGKICKDGELLLIVKTLQSEFDGVAATIRELHSYELPEILSFGVSQGDQRFLDWIEGSVDKDADFSDEEEDEIAYAADPDDTDF